MQRRLVLASAMAVVVTAAFLPGSGLGSLAVAARTPHRIPAGLAAAIRARFGGSASRDFAGPLLGLSVSLSADGTTALVGAPGGFKSQGYAYVFHVSDAGSWLSSETPVATLTYKPGQFFGITVALSADGTTAFVGASRAGGSARPGAIYVFHASAEDTWASSSTPAATLTASGAVGLGGGLALSADGTTLVTGAPYYFGLAGGAYVFHVASESGWATTSTPTATLSNFDESTDDQGVGTAVAISGDGMTALLSDSSNPSGGGAYVFHVAAEDAWVDSTAPTAILSDTNSVPMDALGEAVALSADGSVALLGAPQAKTFTGSADVFHSAGGAGAWASSSTPTARLTAAGGAKGDAFGIRVVLSADGTTALATAPGRHAGRGAASVFHVASEGVWASSSAPIATLTNAGAHADDLLATAALSTDGATALVGVPGVRFQTGAANVFHVSDESAWASSAKPTALLAVAALYRCVVPKLVGMKLSAAKSALKARSCRLGRVTRVVRSKAKRGHVVSQGHPAGLRLPVNAKITVRVGR